MEALNNTKGELLEERLRAQNHLRIGTVCYQYVGGKQIIILETVTSEASLKSSENTELQAP